MKILTLTTCLLCILWLTACDQDPKKATPPPSTPPQENSCLFQALSESQLSEVMDSMPDLGESTSQPAKPCSDTQLAQFGATAFLKLSRYIEDDVLVNSMAQDFAPLILLLWDSGSCSPQTLSAQLYLKIKNCIWRKK